MTADRDRLDPAKLSIALRTSFESVMEVLAFILLVSYHHSYPLKYMYAPKMHTSTSADPATSFHPQLARVCARSSGVTVANVRLWIRARSGSRVIWLTTTITMAETIVISTLQY